jgi:hypothetical protein
MEKKRYAISSTGDMNWHRVNAKSLRGAKMAASRTYSPSGKGKIEVAVENDEGYDIIAIKYGYDKNWTDIV